jgi:L-rhamnose isomerase/sugar isomerase
VELVEAEERAGTRIEYMIAQSHNIEPKIEAVILGVTNLQEAYAKALLVDREVLAGARRSGDVLGAHRLLLDAYGTDVRPLCAKVREDLGGSADPSPRSGIAATPRGLPGSAWRAPGPAGARRRDRTSRRRPSIARMVNRTAKERC